MSGRGVRTGFGIGFLERRRRRRHERAAQEVEELLAQLEVIVHHPQVGSTPQDAPVQPQDDASASQRAKG